VVQLMGMGNSSAWMANTVIVSTVWPGPTQSCLLSKPLGVSLTPDRATPKIMYCSSSQPLRVCGPPHTASCPPGLC
jgi:hypothetical protein